MRNFFKLSMFSMTITFIFILTILGFVLVGKNMNITDIIKNQHSNISVTISEDKYIPEKKEQKQDFDLRESLIHSQTLKNYSNLRKDFAVVIPPQIRLIEKITALIGDMMQ